jgi:hypothetical protein
MTAEQAHEAGVMLNAVNPDGGYIGTPEFMPSATHDGAQSLSPVTVIGKRGIYFGADWALNYGSQFASPPPPPPQLAQRRYLGGASGDATRSTLERVHLEAQNFRADTLANLELERDGSVAMDLNVNTRGVVINLATIVAETAGTVWALLSDQQSRNQATIGAINGVEAVGSAIAHPIRSYDATVNATSRFIDLSGGEQAEAIYSGAFKYLLGAGANRISQFALAKGAIGARRLGLLETPETRLGFRGIEAAERQAITGPAGTVDATGTALIRADVIRELRQSGTIEGAAVAKLLKRNIVRAEFSDIELKVPRGGEQPYFTNVVKIYTRYAGNARHVAGLIVHETEHVLQRLTPRNYANGSVALKAELAAYKAQRSFEGVYAKYGTDAEVMGMLVASPLYPQITQSVVEAFVQSGSTYVTRLSR